MNYDTDAESFEPTPYAVLCPHHGRVYITAKCYEQQMMRPDARWECPRYDADPENFGLCGEESEFDDDNYEAATAEGE